ncbi:NACHT, LRR and PYD domains-containing protein 6-like [Hydra vulgaris]|uniref:NACHT, LRR and PYD domains-containing protein 6-like n=1 Tax=Hydra vulgaris TaxID=6087 RepID=A0ABM4DQG8_HYDVU
MDMKFLQSQPFKLKFSISVGVDWKTLGRWLLVKDNYLNIIERSFIGVENQAYQMLTKWIETNENPTMDDLTTALKNMERVDLIREVEKIKKSSPFGELIARNISLENDVSEVCLALKNFYLKTYDKIEELRPPSKTPCKVNILNKFVELCVVDAIDVQKDVVYGVERKRFLEKQMSYTPIPYEEFVKEESSVLISGIAGIGKTWLLRKCLLDWSNGLIWKNVYFLFYLECRQLNQYQNISNINELLNVFYKDILKEFDICSHSIMFIIDGLDEFKYLNELITHKCEYPVLNVFAELKKYRSLISGRVSAIDQYQNMFIQSNNYSTIQVMGFNENRINDYIENNVTKETKDVVTRVFKESSIAKSMATVPFYLSSMCKIISVSTQKNEYSFLNMTELYASIFLYFLQKHISRKTETIFKMMENETNKKFVFNICKIAYCLFNENKVIFSREEIQNIISDFDKDEGGLDGFIEKIETNLGFHYQFVHLTIMEFCTSVYAYNNFSGKEIMVNKRLRSCLPMICGLTNKNPNFLLKFLTKLNSFNTNKITLNNICELFAKEKVGYFDFETQKVFMECFYESQAIIKEDVKTSIIDIIDKREWNICLDNGKTFYEVSCQMYFIKQFINAKSLEKRLESLIVYKNVFSEDEKNLIIECATNVRYVFFSHPIKIDGWEPKKKIIGLWIDTRNCLILKKDFESFLPWFHVCKELNLYLHDETDFTEDIYKWIRFLNIKKLWIKYRGKIFHTHVQWKHFLNNLKST